MLTFIMKICLVILIHIITPFLYNFLFKSFAKIELSYALTINQFTTAGNCMKSESSYKNRTGVFSLVGNYLRPYRNSRQSVFNINVVVLIHVVIICKHLRSW